MKLQEERKKAGFSQSQLAKEVGMNVGTLQHYEQGNKSFDHARIDTILKVCIALSCKIDDVIENPEYIELLKQYRKIKK